ncbi:hypothetical protein EDF32_1810 [Cellulomonas sp. PhB143]|nr:hypothetical protein EDF32_1810 [Cellulomonas sp. PhB143]
MTAWLLAAQAAGLLERQPPRLITDHLLPHGDRTPGHAATMLSHVAYGVGAGLAYQALVPRSRRDALTGAGYGIALWAAGYEGWVPALGILPPAHRDDRRRAATMLTAHLVYGASLGRLSR